MKSVLFLKFYLFIILLLINEYTYSQGSAIKQALKQPPLINGYHSVRFSPSTHGFVQVREIDEYCKKNNIKYRAIRMGEMGVPDQPGRYSMVVYCEVKKIDETTRDISPCVLVAEDIISRTINKTSSFVEEIDCIDFLCIKQYLIDKGYGINSLKTQSGKDYYEINLPLCGSANHYKMTISLKPPILVKEEKEAAVIAEQKRQEDARLAEIKRQEAARLAEINRQAEAQRQEAARLAEIQRQEAARVAAQKRNVQIQANSNKTLWKLGSKICTEKNGGIYQAVIDQWNEDKSSVKVVVVSGPSNTFEGQKAEKGSSIWISPNGWHLCLDDEIQSSISNDNSSPTPSAPSVIYSQPASKCYTCKGTGRCVRCFGMGGKIHCPNHDTNGDGNCTDCKNTGYVTCHDCYGNQACPTCHGSGN